MNEQAKLGTWKLVIAAYVGLSCAFALARIALISGARDPYVWGVEIPRSGIFQAGCGAAAFVLGLGGLLALGFVADRGTGKQLLIAMLALPLVLILLEIVNMGF